MIPEFPNEVGSNPVVAIVLHTRDGLDLRWDFPEVQQSRAMMALGQFLADLGVEADFSFLVREEVPDGR